MENQRDDKYEKIKKNKIKAYSRRSIHVPCDQLHLRVSQTNQIGGSGHVPTTEEEISIRL